MAASQNFTGLTMPVFTAFGWAGEETALKFALAQLEAFIGVLHRSLPRRISEKFPVFGLSQESQAVYLAATGDPESDVYLAFHARPLSFEIQLIITDTKALEKGLKQANKEPSLGHRLITELGPEWSLRVQQMQVDEDSGEKLHYQDLFKDSITALDEETAEEVFSKAEYLNNDDRWVTPIYLSRRFPAEQVSAMGTAVIDVMHEQIEALLPVLNFLTGQTKRSQSKSKSKAKSRAKTETAAPAAVDSFDVDEGFTYVSTLKPLHLRRGFVNLTPKHWPFFAINSRTETRDVTIYYNGVYDKSSSVWRLVPNDQARVVLSRAVHQWLEDSFQSNDRIQVVAKRIDDEEIQISLKPVA